MKPCVCTTGLDGCEFEFEGWHCSRERGHSGEHVACSQLGHRHATAPNTQKPVSAVKQLKENLDKIENAAKAIQELSKRAEDLFQEQIEPLAKTEQDKNWLWDYCFNPSEDDEYTKMVSKHVVDILSR